MENAKSENPKTMEEVQDSSSWGEWTIIHGDKENIPMAPVPAVPEGKPQEVSGDDDKENECSVVEEAREVIEEIDPSTLGNCVIPSARREENSDGISGITDSDKGVGETKGEATKIVEALGQTITRIPPYANFIAACCLAAAIGFGIGCVVGTGNTQHPPPNIQVTPKTSFRIADEAKTDVSGDDSITIDSEPFNPSSNGPNAIDQEQMTEGRHDMLEDLTKVNNQNLNIRNFQQIPTYKNSLQKLKLSLETLCSLLDKDQMMSYENICNRNSNIFEVIELENTVKYLVNEFGYNDDVSMKKFVEGIDSKIGTVVTSFLDRLSKIVEKMRGKLYHRICLIKNTYDNGAKIQEILNHRLISLENCGNSASRVSNTEKKKFSKREINSESEETIDVESFAIQGSTELPESNNKKNKRNKSQKNDFKKYKSNHQNTNENSNEQKNINSLENADNKEKIHFKSNKNNNKYKKSKNWNENSSEETHFNSFEDQKENKNGHRNDYKPSKKYGSPKGEPKENFVEKKHGNDYEALNEDNKQQNENICYSKKCSKAHDSDEKNNRKGNGKNGQWQFERARGRGKYRSDEEDMYGVWYDDRAKARERARLGF